jgi:hypothetical protein
MGMLGKGASDRPIRLSLGLGEEVNPQVKEFK